MRVAAVILAAGAGTRFGGPKLRAELDGRPLVGHVVDAAVRAKLDPIVVVEGPDGALDDVDLGPARRVRNPTPADGLSGSVRIGLRALDADAAAPTVDAAVILPADQPRVRAQAIEALIAAAAAHPGVPFVVARHADDANPNPVLARRSVWRLADELAGDRGFGPILATHPELILDVPVAGSNPDVDTTADLERLAGPDRGRRDVS
jgi:CTP:molybdopterin cytidylyltransferase MocA